MDSATEIDLDELLKDVVAPSGGSASQSSPPPRGFDFNVNQVNPFSDIKTGGLSKETMFSMAPEARGEKKRDPSEPDLTLTHFEKVEKFFADTPHKLFDTAEFYKTVLKAKEKAPHASMLPLPNF